MVREVRRAEETKGNSHSVQEEAVPLTTGEMGELLEKF